MPSARPASPAARLPEPARRCVPAGRTAAAPALLAALAALALGLGLAACGDGPPAARQGPATATLPAGVDLTVERVVDGDTLVVSGRRTVRLIGVDTPETKDPRRAVGCFGRQASEFTTSLLPKGTTVRLVGDVEQRDRYDRTLAYVYRLPDGLFVNAELLRQGYAEVLTIAPNVAHAAEFADLAGAARSSGRGLWQACGHP